MTVFLVATALLLLVSLAILLAPLLRGGDVSASMRRSQNIAIARERLAELEAGGVDESLIEEARRDIENALAEDLAQVEQESGGSGRSSRGTALGLLLIVPLVSIGLYLYLGHPGAVNPPPVPSVAAPGDVPPLDTLLAQLEQKLAENPDNADGWALAGRTYMSLGRFDRAESAYATLHDLVGDDPDVLTAWADATIMANQFQFLPVAMSRIQRALEIDPDQGHALWISALAAEAVGEFDEALAFLERLAPQVQGDEEARQAVAQMQARLQTAAGRPAGTVDQPAAPASSEPDTNASLVVNVRLDPAMTDGISPELTLFVFARAVDGPPMPLAVSRHTVAELPLTTRLDDSSAMMEALKLSGFETVNVVARISSSGQPVAQPGDIESAPVKVRTDRQQPVELLLNQRVSE